MRLPQVSSRRVMHVALMVAASSAFTLPAHAQRAGNPAAAEAIKARYSKLEVRIPMRDGVKLFTSIYVPRDTASDHPILMDRTPYGVAPYGADAYRTSLGRDGDVMVVAPDGDFFKYLNAPAKR